MMDEIVYRCREFAEFCSANGYRDRSLIRHICVELLIKNGMEIKEAVKLSESI